MSDELNTVTPVAPTLTLDPFEGTGNQELAPEIAAKPATQAEQAIIDAKLSPEEQAMVDSFAKQINVTDSNLVMQYGAGAQKKIADFSDTALDSVKTQDLGEVGDMLSSMVVELKRFDVDEQDKGFMGFFKKSANKIEGMKAKYAAAETNVNKICDVLEGHQIQLLKDIAMLDKMYDINKTYFKELSMYILAGKKKLEQVQTVDLPELVKKSQMSGLPEDAQAANDLASMCNRFEKKLHDLELTRMISMQMAPQIRLVQNNADPDDLHANGTPNPSGPKQRYPHGRKNPILPGQHHSPVEKPNGISPGGGPFHRSRQGSKSGDRYDQPAPAKKCRNPWTSKPSRKPTSPSSPPLMRCCKFRRMAG